MDIIKQIELGILVCPKTKQRLNIDHDNHCLTNADKSENYRYLRNEIPVLISDTVWAEKYANASEKMNKEYCLDSVRESNSLLSRIKSKLTQDYRTESSNKAFLGLLQDQPSDALCISIGGGPTRVHPKLINLNIGQFPNVDIVADAHLLPYADGCVDAIYCEAVFEHLSNPVKAAEEMFRVLKHGKKAYVCTPFLQAYHGYPHHYQNYTTTGQKHLFDSVGFQTVEGGTCVGPVYTVVNLVATFFHEYTPFPLNKFLRIVWGTIGVIIRPLDKILGKRENAYILASTTYIVVKKD